MNGRREKVLRSVPFQKRLLESCDNNAHCPPLHMGRLGWLKEELAKRGVRVSIQSVARWLDGESRPKQDKCEVLARVLGVDEIWLFVGDKLSKKIDVDTDKGLINLNPSLPIALRPGLNVTISGMPLDLSAEEAKKIANIVLAHVSSQADSLNP